MSNRGVTVNGFVKKRLDEIMSEVQADLSEGWGFDVSLNPQSFANVLATTLSDRIAMLWEVAEQIYFSHTPSSAEGVSLDNAAQFGGITREGDRRTVYTILCTGKDRTIIPKDSRIASNTTPQIFFTAIQDYEINRNAFNKAVIKPVTASANTRYAVTINGVEYAITTGEEPSDKDIVTALQGAITDTGFALSLNADENQLIISCNNERASNVLVLSENLTTETVSSLFMFHSEEYGKIVLPPNSITQIVTTIVGFSSCYNLPSPSYGRLRETDEEFRQSYLQKIASRSSMMLETIVSAILENVDNVQSASAYQNDSLQDTAQAAEACIQKIREAIEGAEGNEAIAAAIAEYDQAKQQYGDGIPAHTIEVVVDGGDDMEIAEQILTNKAAGIGTHGSVSVEVPDSFGNTITVRFNRPENVYVWLKVVVQKNPTQLMPTNAEDIIKDTICGVAADLDAGDAVLTQDFITDVRNNCFGIAYIDITAYQNTDQSAAPTDEEYTERFIYPSQRQKAIITKDRIEVVINGT